MEAFNSMLDKVKTHPDVMDKVHSVLDKVKKHPEVIEKVAEVLHLGKHGNWTFDLWLLYVDKLTIHQQTWKQRSV